MLQPSDRRLLFDALTPPLGFQLDYAIGTSFTLDLLSILSAPVAFAFSQWQDSEGRPTTDPLTLLKAVREYGDRIGIFFQAGRIHVPTHHHPLFTCIESSLFETTAPRGGCFHPKVWFLRFHNSDEEIRYRFLCNSRNMTFDRAWDTMLSLDGTLTDRKNAFANNHPLGRFVESLPGLAVRDIGKTWQTRIRQVADEIRRVHFELPLDVEEVKFWPIGIDAGLSPERDWPLRESSRTLIVSPFVSNRLLSKISATSKQVQLISRADELDRINPDHLAYFCNVWILDDSANPEPGESEQAESPENRSESNVETGADEKLLEATNSAAMSGLHAKLYVLDEGRSASIFTGSANATDSAFSRNVEFLTELKGKKSRLGVERILGTASQPSGLQPGAASLRDLLRTYQSGEAGGAEETPEEAFERRVSQIAHQMSEARLVAICQLSGDGDGYDVSLVSPTGKAIDLDREMTIFVRLASLPKGPNVAILLDQSVMAVFRSISILSLSSFFVFRVEVTAPKKMQKEFVLNIPLVDEPSGRREALLQNLLGDKQRVLRFIMLLLADVDAASFAQILSCEGDSPGSVAFVNLLNSPTLFEGLIKSVEREPERLQQIHRLLQDLEQSKDGQELVPDEINAIWTPIWNVAQEMLAPKKGANERSRNGR